MVPVVNAVSEELADQAEFYNVDVKEQADIAQKFDIQSIPALVLFKDGKEIDRLLGKATEEEIKSFVTQ
ncbi:thioredoxin family protein [Aquibacillus salsiterrae]|uniref:Thioredoxin family protein n=1 Tax=Aquibacillus salsiterrae TaxID=2950439 RepID=A0A9X3WH89_9BACI|nr:thioredoxin domain-containing protein [Aquibacillus salsiterrae]MDC3417419.1 thioredoxin family protein [Aquibacillus salsiterrae]